METLRKSVSRGILLDRTNLETPRSVQHKKERVPSLKTPKADAIQFEDGRSEASPTCLTSEELRAAQKNLFASPEAAAGMDPLPKGIRQLKNNGFIAKSDADAINFLSDHIDKLSQSIYAAPIIKIGEKKNAPILFLTDQGICKFDPKTKELKTVLSLPCKFTVNTDPEKTTQLLFTAYDLRNIDFVLEKCEDGDPVIAHDLASIEMASKGEYFTKGTSRLHKKNQPVAFKLGIDVLESSISKAASALNDSVDTYSSDTPLNVFIMFPFNEGIDFFPVFKDALTKLMDRGNVTLHLGQNYVEEALDKTSVPLPILESSAKRLDEIQVSVQNLVKKQQTLIKKIDGVTDLNDLAQLKQTLTTLKAQLVDLESQQEHCHQQLKVEQTFYTFNKSKFITETIGSLPEDCTKTVYDHSISINTVTPQKPGESREDYLARSQKIGKSTKNGTPVVFSFKLAEKEAPKADFKPAEEYSPRPLKTSTPKSLGAVTRFKELLSPVSPQSAAAEHSRSQCLGLLAEPFCLRLDF